MKHFLYEPGPFEPMTLCGEVASSFAQTEFASGINEVTCKNCLRVHTLKHVQLRQKYGLMGGSGDPDRPSNNGLHQGGLTILDDDELNI